MITNFEKYTSELNEEEKKILPVLIKGFSLKNKSKPVKSAAIVKALQDKGYKISGPRIRKLCNFIRSKGILPLIATSQGYYVSYNQEEIKLQIKSLQERAEGIMAAAKGLEKYIDR